MSIEEEEALTQRGILVVRVFVTYFSNTLMISWSIVNIVPLQNTPYLLTMWNLYDTDANFDLKFINKILNTNSSKCTPQNPDYLHLYLSLFSTE